MNSSRKPRGIPPTQNGIQKLKEAKANLKDANSKPLSYEDIAEKAGVDEKTVGRFFRGQAVDNDSVIRIVQALNLDINEIVDPKDLNPPTPTTTPTEINWREICTKVLATQHLRRQATAQQYELNIYVPLGLMDRPKTPNPRQNATGEESPPQKEPELQIVQTYKDDAFFLKVIAENHTKKGKHIAIIGEPGAGKTTLLGELAQRLAKNTPDFPICIRLADLRSSTIADYLLNNWFSKALQFIDFEAENVTPEIRKSFKQLFAAGKVWLLLDGVDEMAATSPIEALARIQEQLTDWVGKARVVLTCRLNVWDAAISNTLTDFDTYKTLEFEPDDVDEFICLFFEEASQDEKRRNSGNETFWQEQGKRLTRQLKEPGKDNIRRMVRNPLRLSMLCQSWCVPQQELPQTKAALYEQFTTYFFEWKQEEFSKKQRVLNQRDKKQIQQALAKLALAAMESVNRFRIEQDFAIEQMEEVWFKRADELGWLVLVDRDTRTKKPVYAFFHPTFQEYFAACAIEDWHFFLLHQIPPVSDCSYRIFERQWREVILLWLGRGEIEGKQKEEFIDALVNFEDGCGEWSHEFRVDRGFYEYQAYFLAAAGIAEFEDYSQTDELVGQIVKWDLGYYHNQENYWIHFLPIISDVARKAFLQTHRAKAIDTLSQLLNSSHLDINTCWQVLEILSKISPGNQTAIDTLSQLLNSPHLSDKTRLKVAESLGEIDPGNRTAIDALVQLLTSLNLNYYARIEVIYSLGKIGQGNQTVIDALVQLLNSRHYTCEVVSSLEKISQGNQTAINALVELLNSPHLDEKTCWTVAFSLGRIDPGNQIAINAWAYLLNSPHLYDYNRREVAKILGNIGQGNQTALDALVQWLTSANLCYETYSQVTESLEKIGMGNQTAIDTLVQRLISPDLDQNTCCRVAESLGNIGQGNQTAIDALAQVLNYPHISDETRAKVAKSLEKIGQGNQTAIDALLQRLISADLERYSPGQVAESLGNIGQGNQTAIDTLVQLLNSPDLDRNTRWQAAKSLGKIGQGNQTAINTLVQLLNSPDLDRNTRWQAAESLGNIGQGNQAAIDTLVQLLNSPYLDHPITIAVVKNLGKIGKGNQKAIDALVQGLIYLEPNGRFKDPRCQAAESLGNIAVGNQKAIDALVQLLISPQFDYFTRNHIAESLWRIAPGNQKVLDALVQEIISPYLDYYTRRQMVRNLWLIGGNQKAINALVQCLTSWHLDQNSCGEEIENLGLIATGNQKGIDALVQLLTSENIGFAIHKEMVAHLGEIALANQTAIDFLVQLLNSPHIDNFTRCLVADSLWNIDPGNEIAIGALVQWLNSLDSYADFITWKLPEILEKIGQGNQTAINTLEQRLNSPDLNNFTRCRVATILGEIDPGNQIAIDNLLQLLNSPGIDKGILLTLPKILGNIGKGNQTAIDALLQLLNSPDLVDPGVKYCFTDEVAKSLSKISIGNPISIDTLVQLLNSPALDNDTCRLVASILGEIGIRNQKAIDALVQLLNSRNLSDCSRWQVESNLKKIETDKQFAIIAAFKANFNNSQQIDERCYELIWHYAQNLPYPDFYQAWHQDTLTNTARESEEKPRNVNFFSPTSPNKFSD
ncbi:HEAT repeat domain-containing protein [Aerosakkonemataceae cyanobacterium BLCC-F50]|uniref:HEAT repeat domain-containing protein n=1 Tax=Floridaenema flaviceps BLCC-F50 TaxID=3153642 RepID=A0ABV4XZT1_9CYAN